MKLILSNDELSKLIYTCFVDGGLSELRRSDVELIFDGEDYQVAKKATTENFDKSLMTNPIEVCYEDILIVFLKSNFSN